MTIAVVELTHDGMRDVGGVAFHVFDDRVLVRCGLLRCCELAVKQRDRHKCACASAEDHMRYG